MLQQLWKRSEKIGEKQPCRPPCLAGWQDVLQAPEQKFLCGKAHGRAGCTPAIHGCHSGANLHAADHREAHNTVNLTCQMLKPIDSPCKNWFLARTASHGTDPMLELGKSMSGRDKALWTDCSAYSPVLLRGEEIEEGAWFRGWGGVGGKDGENVFLVCFWFSMF